MDELAPRALSERRQIAMLDLAERFRNLSQPDDLAFAAAEVIGRALGVSRAGYGTIDLRAETITIERDWNSPGIKSLAGVLRFRDYGSYIDDLKRGETVVFEDARTDARTRVNAAALEAISARSVVNMPVTEHGGFVALLYLNHEDARAWLPEELDFLRDVAERTRSVVERARAEAELRALNSHLEKRVAERTAELERAQEQLRQSQKMEAIGQLTGGIAHDFNNLLTGITGSLEMLESRMRQGRLSECDHYVKAAHGAARRAAALTHRLLAFSRRQTLDPKPTDINRLVTGLTDLIQRTVGPEIILESVLAAGLWNTRVDPGQLENALLNLCINSRDAMPHGGKITIETGNRWFDERMARERDIPPGQYVSLCVSDTGTGMSPDVIARAFDPFFTTKPIGMGTGLGLSMIYGFARQSGGEVRIYSEVGNGATICLYLPRELTSVESLDAPQAPPPATPAAQHETVLVVDDEPTVRMLVVDVLEDAGYAVMDAMDGPSAMKVIHSGQRIDLLVSDVGLPNGMNGRQLADAARAVRPDLRVLFITGYAENAVLSHGHLDPGMHVLTKPFTMDTLGRRVKDLIAR